MAQQSRSMHLPRLFAVGLTVALFASLVPLASVSAAVGVVAATGGTTISADTNSTNGSGVYTTLTGPSLQEGAAGDLATGGSIILTAPAGFQFNPVGSPTASAGGVGCAGMTLGAVTTSPTGSTVTIPITASSMAPCTITVSGLQVRPTTPLAGTTGNITNTGTCGPAPGNYGVLTEVAGAPVLTFTTQPSNGTGGVPLATQPKVHDQDAEGNNRAGDSILLSITPGTGTAGATLTCTTNPLLTLGSGDAQFAGCSVDKAGTGYQLRATTASAQVDSTPFNISLGAATKLTFTSYPASTTPALLTPQPAVAVTDAGGNVITTDNSTVITLAISANAGTFTCTGGLSKTVTAGVATFTGCTQTVNGTYQLTATSSPVWTPVTGPTFTVSSGLASKLAFCWSPALACPTTPPAGSTGGAPFVSQPTIRVEDGAGNTVSSDSTTVVTLSILTGTPTSGGPGTLTCTGGNSKTVTAGVATFTGCSIDKAGVAYQLNATSSPALTPAASGSFSVSAGAATKLAFVVQPPASATTGTAFPGSIQVAITDAGGNVVTSGIAATISLSIGNNPGGATLTCTSGTSAATVNGVATFTGCSLNKAGAGYTLIATATSTTPVTVLAPATSTPINVGSLAAVIILTTSPGLNGATPPTAVIVWGQHVTLTAHFAGSGANRTFALEVTKDLVTWSTIASLTTNASGDASFVYGPSDNRYYRANFAGASDLGAGMSPIVRVVVRSIILLRPTNAGAVKTVHHGTVVTFTATARPNRPELPQQRANFVVYRLTSSGWQKVIDETVAVDRTSGKATLIVTFNTAGQYYVRAQLVPTPVNANSGWTRPERYHVT